MSFLVSPLLMASLRNRPREAPGLVQNRSVKGGLCQPWGSLHTKTTHCPSLAPQGQSLQEDLGLWYQVPWG